MVVRGKFLETVLHEPPEGWKHGHVTLTLRYPDERKAVQAWRRGAFAVHELADQKGARLTHAPTGFQIWTCDTMGRAAELAEAIEPLADWAAISEAIPAGNHLYPKVRAVIDQITLEAAHGAI